mgnify:CR=1 FL=1
MTGVPRQEMPTLNVGKANAIRTSSCGVHGNVGYAGANLTHTPAAIGPIAEIGNVRFPTASDVLDLTYEPADRLARFGSYATPSSGPKLSPDLSSFCVAITGFGLNVGGTSDLAHTANPPPSADHIRSNGRPGSALVVITRRD